MSTWKKLPVWVRIPVLVLLFLVLLYLFGFLVFGCGSEGAETISRGPGVDFAG